MITETLIPSVDAKSSAELANDAQRSNDHFTRASLGGAGGRVPRSGWHEPSIGSGHPLSDRLDLLDMARLVEGDAAALASLISRHAPILRQHIYRVLRNSTETADVVEEAFVRVYQYRESFKSECRFATWLYTIAFNLARNVLRRRRRQPEFLPLETDETADDEVCIQALVDPCNNPVQSLEMREVSRQLADALDALPAHLSEAVVRFACNDESQADIAASLGCSLRTVEMRLYHGRRRLRTLLQKQSRSEWPRLYPAINNHQKTKQNPDVAMHNSHSL